MPKSKWEGYQRFCPLARGLDVIGERWTLVIVHELLGGPARFNTLLTGLPGISTNVLTDRLRKLEAAGVVQRTAGDVGRGVSYGLTGRGEALGPLLAEIRRWGADELLADDEERCFDLRYTLDERLQLDETYEWRVDGRPTTLTIRDRVLTQHPAPADDPAVVVETSADFMRRWAAGDTTWDRGRADGEVDVDGPEEAWQRMLVATNYPGRPADLAERILEAQLGERPASGKRSDPA